MLSTFRRVRQVAALGRSLPSSTASFCYDCMFSSSNITATNYAYNNSNKMQSKTADFAPVPPPGELDETYLT